MIDVIFFNTIQVLEIDNGLPKKCQNVKSLAFATQYLEPFSCTIESRFAELHFTEHTRFTGQF